MAEKDTYAARCRRQKESLLPQVSQLALEGDSCRVIAKKLGLSKTTAHRWLLELREIWLAKATQNTEQWVGIAIARCESIYREAMQGLRDSKAYQETLTP